MNYPPLERYRKKRQEDRRIRLDKTKERSDPERRHFSHTGNVFYPEGILNLTEAVISGDFDISDGSFGKGRAFLDDITTQLQIFYVVVSHLIKENKIHIEDESFALIGHYILSFINENKLSEEFLKRGRKLTDDEIKLVRKIISENMNIIRDEWIKLFYQCVNGEKDVFSLVGHKPRAGIIFGPNLEVSISDSGDYPTQGVIRDINNKRHIIGLFINTSEIKLEDKIFDRSSGDEHHHLHNIIHGLSNVLPINEFMEFIDSDERLTRLFADKKLELKIEENPQTRLAHYYIEGTYSLSQENLNYLTQKIHNLYFSISAAQDTMTYLDYYRTLGSKYGLPVYDLKGNLLWPKKLSHTEVAGLKNKTFGI